MLRRDTPEGLVGSLCHINDDRAAVSLLTHRLERLRKEVKKRKRQQSKDHRFGWAWERAATLTSLSKGNLNAARHFLNHHSKLNSSQCQALDKQLATWWIQRTESAEITSERDSFLQCPSVLKQATKYLAEYKLYAWVEQQNLTKGLAPHTAIVNSVRHPKNMENVAQPLGVVSRVGRTRKQWLRRWRHRWSVKVGTIPAGERLPDDVAQKKARPLSWSPTPPPP